MTGDGTRAGHATPGTNTALSDCSSAKMCRLPPLSFNVHRDSSRGEDTTICPLVFFSLQLPACLSPFVQSEEKCQNVCRYCTCDVSICESTTCKNGHVLSYPCHLPSTSIRSSDVLAMNVDLCEFYPPSPALFSVSFHLLSMTT